VPEITFAGCVVQPSGAATQVPGVPGIICALQGGVAQKPDLTVGYQLSAIGGDRLARLWLSVAALVGTTMGRMTRKRPG
jgi:hypothetical protein